MKNIESYLKTDSNNSMMRLMCWEAFKAGRNLAYCIVIGTIVGVVIALFLGKESSIGALLGGAAAFIGATVGMFLIPSFGGKAAQSFAEKDNIDNPTENINNKG
jgi:uncharacterized membrane protein YeaQ/YmgE (transglycosylase-associated protein family)